MLFVAVNASASFIVACNSGQHAVHFNSTNSISITTKVQNPSLSWKSFKLKNTQEVFSFIDSKNAGHKNRKVEANGSIHNLNEKCICGKERNYFAVVLIEMYINVREQLMGTMTQASPGQNQLLS